MRSSITTGELTKALVNVQSNLKIAIKDKANPFFKSKYADLQTVWDTARKLLTENGLAVAQLPGGDGEHVIVTTTLLHTSGEWIADDGLAMKPAKQDPQGVASCITYARRYGFMAVVGVVSDEDDDGEAAVGRGINKPHNPAIHKELRDDPRPASKATITITPEEVEDPRTIGLLAALTAVKAQGGWNAAAHRDAWKKKHQAEIDVLPVADRLEVSKAFTTIQTRTNGNG